MCEGKCDISLVDPGLGIGIRIRTFLGLPDPQQSLYVRLRIFLSTSKKFLISTIFFLLFCFLSLKSDVNVPSKRNKQKKLTIKA